MVHLHDFLVLWAVCKTPDGMTKGFGFVRFYNEQEHREALRRMDGVRGLGNRPIFVKLATPKPRYVSFGLFAD